MHNIHAGRRAIRPSGLRAARGALLTGTVAIVMGVAGCGSSTGVDTIANPEEPTEDVLYDFRAQDVRLPAAFDVVSGAAVRLDSNSRWDFLFQLRPDGTAQLRPRGAVLEERSDAGFVKLEAAFDEIGSAPVSGYQSSRAMVVAEGDVLAVQSQRDAIFAPVRCRRYAKIEILEIDASAGTLSLKHLINPNCENRNLVPGAAVPVEDQ